MKRQVLIAGNWKMNKTPAEARDLVRALKPMVAGSPNEVLVCPSYVCLDTVKREIESSNIKLGAQNIDYHEKGAYTGEISYAMVEDFGLSYVIIGHSERRQYYNETDESVNKKAQMLLSKGVRPIICVGENLEQRESGVTDDFVSMQVKKALNGMLMTQIPEVVIAYEPIWALGTGLTASATDANSTIKMIRATVRGMYGDVADEMRILYGGSMNEKNASELLGTTDIDGGLIGGAALDASKFSRIVSSI